MQLEYILRRLQPQRGFVYDRIEWAGTRARRALHVHIRPRKRSHGICSKCCRKRPGYDTLPPRLVTFVPFWGIAVFFVYAMRRVSCPTCGVTVEMVPLLLPRSRGQHDYAAFFSSSTLFS
jgi:hypothetical protein